jgi:hypothetical protein
MAYQLHAGYSRKCKINLELHCAPLSEYLAILRQNGPKHLTLRLSLVVDWQIC